MMPLRALASFREQLWVLVPSLIASLKRSLRLQRQGLSGNRVGVQDGYCCRLLLWQLGGWLLCSLR
jgi:hypothetical protein